MGTGFRTDPSGGVAAPPYTNGPYTFSEVITFEDNVTVEGNLSVEGNMVFGDAAVDTLTIGGTVTVSDDNKFYFRDSGLYLWSSADGQLDIVADTSVAISGAVSMDSSLSVSGDISLENGYIYSGDTESGTRKDGVILISGSRAGSQNTQKIVDLNGAPGASYNAWDVFTGAGTGENTILFNIDGKRINTAASGVVTDRGLNITAENQTDSSGGTLDLVGAHVKASNDGGKLQNLKGGHFEVQTDGLNTVAGDVTVLEVQYSDDGTTTLSGSAHGISFTGTDDMVNAFNFSGTGTGGAVEDAGNLKDSANTDILCDGYIVVATNAGTKYIALYDTTV